MKIKTKGIGRKFYILQVFGGIAFHASFRSKIHIENITIAIGESILTVISVFSQ